MSQKIWKEQSKKWETTAGEWQGNWWIVDVELEQNLCSTADEIAHTFDTLIKEGKSEKTFQSLDRLKTKYKGLVTLWEEEKRARCSWVHYELAKGKHSGCIPFAENLEGKPLSEEDKKNNEEFLKVYDPKNEYKGYIL